MRKKSNEQIQLELLREIEQKQKQKKDYDTLIELDLTDPKRKENLTYLAIQGCIDYKPYGPHYTKPIGLSPRGELRIVELEESLRRDRENFELRAMTLAILLMTAALLVLAAVPLLCAFFCR
jgi:hypothetical protein